MEDTFAVCCIPLITQNQILSLKILSKEIISHVDTILKDSIRTISLTRKRGIRFLKEFWITFGSQMQFWSGLYYDSDQNCTFEPFEMGAKVQF